MDHRNVVIVLYAVTLLATAVGVIAVFVKDVWQVPVLAAALLVPALFFRLAGAVSFRKLVVQGRRKRRYSRGLRDVEESYEEARRLYEETVRNGGSREEAFLRAARSFESVICRSAEHGRPRTSPTIGEGFGERMVIYLAVPGSKNLLVFEADVADSRELAAREISRLARLADEAWESTDSDCSRGGPSAGSPTGRE